MSQLQGIDQTALYGLLKKVRDLGMPLLSVSPVEPGQAEASDVNEIHQHRSKKEEKMNTTKKTTEMKDRKVILSTLWIFATLNYLYCDVLALMDSQMLKQIITGTAGGINMTQGFLLGAAILMEIPIAMILLSRVLKYRANRWANIIAGTIMTAVQFSTLFFGSSPTSYYILFSIIEIACTLFIVWYAWKWPHPEGGVLDIAGSGLFNSLQREKEEAKRQDGTGSEGAHVAGHVGDTKPIK